MSREDERGALEAQIVPASQRQDAGTLTPHTVDIGQNILENTKVILNLDQEVCITTRDRITLVLNEKVSKYVDASSLLGVVGVVATLIIALLTTDPRDLMGLSGETWRAIMVIACAVSIVWTVVILVRYLRRPKISEMVDEIIKRSEV